MVFCRPNKLPSVEAKPFGILARGHGQQRFPVAFDWVLLSISHEVGMPLLERVGLGLLG